MNPSDIKTTYIIKVAIITFLELITSTILFSIITEIIRAKNYLQINSPTYLALFTLMLAYAVLASLTLGAWNKYIQYLIIPLPLMGGMVINTIYINSQITAFISIIAFLVIAESVFISQRLRKLLIKEDPKHFLKGMVRAILFCVSISSGIFTIAYTLEPKNTEALTSNLDKFILSIYDSAAKELEKTGQSMITGQNLGQGDINYPIEDYAQEQGRNFKDANDIMKTSVLDKFHQIIQPYIFLLPIIAGLLVWSGLQFTAWLVCIVYSIVIGMIFDAGKKYGLFTVTTIDIKKETLSF